MVIIPKVSVVMPVYNSDKYLSRSIGSFINQTEKDIELICIDDYSTDNSVKEIKKYMLQDKRIKLLQNKKNEGPGKSRNRGIDMARGEYIYFLDSDDWLEPGALEKIYSQSLEGKAEVIFVRPFLHFSGKRIKDPRVIKEVHPSMENLFENTLRREIPWAPWSKAINLKFLNKNKIRFPNIHITEDMIFSYMSIFYAKRFSIISDPIYNYYLRDDSLMSYKNPKRRIENYLDSIKFLEKFLEKNKIKEKFYKSFLQFKFYNFLAISGVIAQTGKLKNAKRIIQNDRHFKFKYIFYIGINSVSLGMVLLKLRLFPQIYNFLERLKKIFGIRVKN